MTRITPLLLLALAACTKDEPEPEDTAPEVVTDEDGDGYDSLAHGGDDCDDADAGVYPGAEEVCDDIDNNCDGEVDGADATGASDWFQDNDGDGIGSLTASVTACEAPSGYVAEDPSGFDCDDDDPLAAPNLDELCDEFDNNCNGSIDEPTATDAETWYTDNDGDGFGNSAFPYTACSMPGGYVDNADDCDDTKSEISPLATEYCDGADNNCDGAVDEDTAADALVWFEDLDGDGYGTLANTWLACSLPTGFADNTDDCDDSDNAISPSGIEVCDSVDNDCDGTVDGPDSIDATLAYLDADADGYGDADNSVRDCTHGSGYVTNKTDCDDTDGDISPGADEYCDAIDNNCDGSVDETTSIDALTWYADVNGDGFGDASSTTPACSVPSGYVDDDTDCDDAESTTYPGADEVCADSVDNDCDGTLDECAPAGTLTAGTDSYSQLQGDAAYDYVGSSVAGVGDLNADGYADMVVGAPGLDTGASAAGGAYVFYGPVTSGNTSVSGADWTFYGSATNANAGSVVAAGGDLNADGYDDVLVAAPNYKLSYNNEGGVFMLQGPIAAAGALETTANVSFVGDSAQALFGTSVSSIGDFNADGAEDFIVGAPGYHNGASTVGAAFIFEGPFSVVEEYADIDAEFSWSGETSGDDAGISVAGVGDTNGDGYDDVMVGAHYYSADAGAAYLILGPATAGSGDLSLADYRFDGENAGDLAGRSLSSAGDLNGDGYDDLLIGAPYYSTGSNAQAGAAYVVFGPVSASGSLSTADIIFEGDNQKDYAGIALDMGGDVDNDGNTDLVIGAYRQDDGGTDAGAGYLFYGPFTATSGAVSLSTADATMVGGHTYARLGYSLSIMGDHDADGYDDLLMGAERDSTVDTYAGTASIFTGDQR